MWKVRYVGADGDLVEETFTGTLGELAETMEASGVPVRVIQWAGERPEAQAADAGRGGDAVAVDKD